MRSMRNRAKIRSFLGFLAFLALTVSWLSEPETVARAAAGGLKLCAQVLIPALFPFLALAGLCVRRDYGRYLSPVLRPLMGPLFGLPDEGAGALALGAVGGYPVGAATAFALYDRGALTADETARLLSFCNNAGPSFILGVAGAVLFRSACTGVLLLAAHLLAALLTGSLLRAPAPRVGKRAAGRPAAAAREEPFAVSFTAAVSTAAGSMLSVCAFVVFFSVLTPFLLHLGALEPGARLLGALSGCGEAAARAVLTGALELSSGVAALGASGCPRGVLLSAVSFLLGWGGLCVHGQVASLRGLRPVSLRPYLLGKLCQGALAAVLIQFLSRGRLALLLLPALLAILAPLWKNRAGKSPLPGV